MKRTSYEYVRYIKITGLWYFYEYLLIYSFIVVISQLGMEEENKTLVTEFVLIGLTDLLGWQIPLFLVFLVIYLTTMVGNLGLIFLIWKDPHLHTPMYLFLGSLAFADACSSSSVTPKMLINFLSNSHLIPLSDCMAQFYFLVSVPPQNVSSWWWWPMTAM